MSLQLYIKEVVSYIVVIPAVVLCYLPLKNQLRYSAARVFGQSIGVYLALALIAPVITLHFGLPENTVLFIAMPLLFYYYLTSTKAHISKLIVIFVAVVALFSILSNYATCIDAFRHPELGVESASYEGIVFQIVITFTVTLAIAYPWTKYGSELIDQLDFPKIWYSSIPFYLVLFTINMAIRPAHYSTLHVGRVGIAMVILLTAMLIMWIIVSVTFHYVVLVLLETYEKETHLNILQMQENQHIALTRYMEDTARARHDFKHTIVTLMKLAEDENIEALKEYLRTYYDGMPSSEVTIYCKNSAMNAILNYYAQLTKEYSTKLYWNFDFDSELGISDVDMCGMVGNILENAIMACEKIPEDERFIQLSITTRNSNYLYIIATNSFDGYVIARNGHYRSTGRDGSGIGLKSIEVTAEQYGGNASFSHAGKEFYTNVVIPLKRPRS